MGWPSRTQGVRESTTHPPSYLRSTSNVDCAVDRIPGRSVPGMGCESPEGVHDGYIMPRISSVRHPKRIARYPEAVTAPSAQVPPREAPRSRRHPPMLLRRSLARWLAVPATLVTIAQPSICNYADLHASHLGLDFRNLLQNKGFAVRFWRFVNRRSPVQVRWMAQ